MGRGKPGLARRRHAAPQGRSLAGELKSKPKAQNKADAQALVACSVVFWNVPECSGMFRNGHKLCYLVFIVLVTVLFELEISIMTGLPNSGTYLCTYVSEV